MSTKEKIIAILQAQLGTPLSGESLATQLGLSRTAIWKAIQSLKADGYEITSTMNKGYTLTTLPDHLDATPIQAAHPDWHIETLATTPSTQENAKAYATTGTHTPALFASEQQTAGRGRLGRTFVSPSQTGLYMSLCLFPDSDATNLSLITCAAAVAVAQTIEHYIDDTIAIKWVNDLYYHDRKVCGILTEAITDVQTMHVQALIIGIGLNITPTDALQSPDLKDIVGTLFDSPEDARRHHFTRTDFITKFLTHWQDVYQALATKSFLPDYKARSLVLGKPIQVIQGTKCYPATALDITEDGHLVVQQPDGTITQLSYGEVSIRPQGSHY